MGRWIASAVMFGLSALAGSGQAFAADSCQPVPAAVSRYLTASPGWRLVEPRDLVPDDRALWGRHHAAACPGMAEVKLSGPKDRAFAIAVIKTSDGRMRERLVLIRKSRQPQVLTDIAGDAPSVVWKAGPGDARAFGTGKRIRIPNESFVFEKMEASATQYFLRSGKIETLLISD